MKISKKTSVSAGCNAEEKKKPVNTVEDINDVQDQPEEDIEAKKNLEIATKFYSLASDHIKHAIDALGEAANSGDKYAKQEIADLSVVLLDLKNLQRMA